MYSLGVHTSKGSPTGGTVTTDAIDTSGANLLVIAITDYSSASSTLSDSKTNTWSALTAQTGNYVRTQMYYVVNPTVGSGHTFTATSVGTSYPSVFVVAFTGAASSPLDTQNGNGSTSAVSLATGSITPAQNDELIMSAWGGEAPNRSANSGMTAVEQQPYNNGLYFAGAIAYKIQTTAAAINVTWTTDYAGYCADTIACFKAAGATDNQEWLNRGRDQKRTRVLNIAY